ncbi:GntR family transcriptional regulator [Kribbella sp. NPDC055071]
MPSPAVRPVENRSVTTQVIAELRRSILSGALPPGESFSLRDLAGQLNVSFIPVREALRDLEIEGLVVTRPGKSATVAPLDRSDLDAIYRLRRILEPELARRSAVAITASELDRLDAFSEPFGDDWRSPEAIDARHDFYVGLFAPAATPWDARLISSLWRAAERYFRAGFDRLESDADAHERLVRAHDGLVSAFRSGDADTAERAVLDHLDYSRQVALASIIE